MTDDRRTSTAAPAGDPDERARPTSPRPDRAAVIVGFAGLVIACTIALRVLIPNGMDPTIFVAFGEDAPIQTAYGHALLGDITVRHGFGHDGKFFFAQANDPWYLEPRENAAILDRPIYRAQRMLFPTIAGGFGFFPPEVVVWAMLITNVLGLAVGAYLAARLAIAWGTSPWLGLWVPLNIGLLFELDIGGSGIVGFACCLGALLFLFRDRAWAAAALFAAAALARETMLAFAIGVFVLWWLERRRPLWSIVIVPIAALGVWYAYLWFRLAGIPGSPPDIGNFSAMPFVGLVDSFRFWLKDPLDLIVSLVILGVIVAFVPIAVRSRLSIAWGALPFAGLIVMLSAFVLREPFDFARVVMPIFTAFPFAVLVPDSLRGVPWATRGSSLDRTG
jgi:hypothetical protein